MDDDRTVFVSIILVNYNGASVVLNCLRSLEQFIHSFPYEVIVVDNNSTDGSPDLIAKDFPTVRLIRQSENRGFGSGNNIGVQAAKGDFLLFLNTDIELVSDPLPHLITLIKDHPNAGIVGPKLLNADGSLQLSTAAAISISGEYHTLKQLKQYSANPNSLSGQQFNRIQAVDIVVGAAFLIRKDLFQTLHGFDETFFMYFEESDLCQRARDLGWAILYTPEVAMIHLGGYSVGKVSQRMKLEYRRSQLYYYQKHRPIWEQIVLRIYLLIKFAIAAIQSRDLINLKIILLVLTAYRFQLKSA